MKTFEDYRKERGTHSKQGSCRRCGHCTPTGVERGMVRVELLAYVPASPEKKLARRSITTTSRTFCEACAVEVHDQVKEAIEAQDTRERQT